MKPPIRRANNWVLLLLLIPFIAVLWPPFYAHVKPEVFGIPMFLWYQFVWTILSSALTIVIYRIWRPAEVADE